MVLILFLKAAAVAAVLILTGCSSGPTKTEPFCDKVSAAGLLLIDDSGSTTIVFNNTVVGAVTVSEGVARDFLVVFLDSDSNKIRLAPDRCPELRLEWDIPDTVVEMSLVENEQWKVRIRGIQAASVSLMLRLMNGADTSYQSPPVSVIVNSSQPHTPVSVSAVAISRFCNDIATWNYDPVRGPNNVSGGIIVEAGKILDNLTVNFLDSLTDTDGFRFVVEPTDPRYRLGFSVTDSMIAEIKRAGSERWEIEVIGRSSGFTSAMFELFFEGVPELTTAPIPIIVRNPIEPAWGDPADFAVTLSGIWKVVVRAGEIKTIDTLCNHRVTPGYFQDIQGVLTPGLYSLRILDGCNRITPSQTRYRLIFDFADPCVARVVAHPIHWGEYFVWHILGLQAGETTMRIHLVRNDHRVEFTSPPIPVVITAP